jgi:twitching motility protein PilJ
MAINFSSMVASIKKRLSSMSVGSFQLTQNEYTQEALSSSRRHLFLQIILFVAFALLSFWVINQVRINGPIFKALNEFDDLTTDISVPAIYPVDAFASYNQAFVAGARADYEKRDQALTNAQNNQKQFKMRADYWRKHLNNPLLKQQLEAAIQAGDNFFFVANKKFIPALKKGAGLATQPLTELTTEFETTKLAANAFLKTVSEENKTLIESKENFIQLVLLGLLLLGVGLMAFMFFSGSKQAARNAVLTQLLSKETEENQEAVKLLLYEMGDLADGDLTVKAQVRDSITGAIADSINYTIDSLRDLVVEINRATEQVTSATSIAQGTSTQLLDAAKAQSVQIKQASETVTGMTESILKVSKNAETAAQVAQKSLQTAKQGTMAVQNTISGMNEIRQQIQETSKRMKRLGESSQEISEIVELISDITEQTNILSLNAAIQAASAGEAGRGFTVVAEEVQRLAERSSEATNQISAIVRTIQTDTNGAVAAMEKSTEGVVEGARVADHAGQALAEIETVTNHLAVLINAISEATKAQTQSATTVSTNMQLIQAITNQTTDTTKMSADSIVKLTALAKELRYSVAGFKL